MGNSFGFLNPGNPGNFLHPRFGGFPRVRGLALVGSWSSERTEFGENPPPQQGWQRSAMPGQKRRKILLIPNSSLVIPANS